MSVKSERRAWYAANVKPMPNQDRSSVEWIAWRDEVASRAKELFAPGTAEPIVTPESPEIAKLRSALTSEPVVSPGRRIASAAAPSSEDRVAYDDFCEAQLRAFGEYTGAMGGHSDDVWRNGAIALAAKSQSRELAFGKGPLKQALKWLNADAREALDAGVIRWVTFAEFKLERAAIRAAEAEDNEIARAEWEAQDCSLCMSAVCECVAIDWAA